MAEIITTLNDVAGRAGVSVSTASRALNGLKVSKGAREKVRKAARELGYVANEGARSLRSERTMTMGVVFMQLGNLLALETLEALTSGVEERGYNLFISTASGQEDRYDLIVHRFLERRVDALLCVNPAGEGAGLERFEAAGIPVMALFHAHGGYRRLPLIGPTTKSADGLAVQRLLAHGHKRLGVIRQASRWGPVETLIPIARAAGMTVRTYEPPEGVLDGVRALQAMVGDADGPTVIAGPQSRIVDLLEAADEMHVLVPRELSLVAIRDRNQNLPPPRLALSTIHLNPERLGKAAAEIACDWLAGQALRNDVEVEVGSWIERASTGPAPGEEAARPPRSSRF